MISQMSCTWSWFQSLILTSGSTLSVKMFSKITTWRFDLSYYVSSVICVSTSTLYTYLSMSHIHMIYVVLWMKSCLSSMLIFEYLCQETFSILIDSMSPVSLYGHTSTMNSVELPSDLSLLSSWTSSTSLRISSTLGYRWSLHFNSFSWSRN
jgi:hypothetical protein